MESRTHVFDLPPITTTRSLKHGIRLHGIRLHGTKQCSICHAQTNIKRCTMCHLTRYCSRVCQRQGYHQHQQICHSSTFWADKGALLEVTTIFPSSYEWESIFKRMFDLIDSHRIHPNHFYFVTSVCWISSIKDYDLRDPWMTNIWMDIRNDNRVWSLIAKSLRKLLDLGLNSRFLFGKECKWIFSDAHCLLIQTVLDHGHDVYIEAPQAMKQMPLATWLILQKGLFANDVFTLSFFNDILLRCFTFTHFGESWGKNGQKYCERIGELGFEHEPAFSSIEWVNSNEQQPIKQTIEKGKEHREKVGFEQLMLLLPRCLAQLIKLYL